MTLDRTAQATEQALLSVHYAPEPSSSSATASPAPTSDSTTPNTSPSAHEPADRVETINMTHSTSAEILEAFKGLTKGIEVQPTAEEKEELRLLEEQRARSARDAKVSADVRARKKREEMLLEQARGDMASNS